MDNDFTSFLTILNLNEANVQCRYVCIAPVTQKRSGALIKVFIYLLFLG